LLEFSIPALHLCVSKTLIFLKCSAYRASKPFGDGLGATGRQLVREYPVSWKLNSSILNLGQFKVDVGGDNPVNHIIYQQSTTQVGILVLLTAPKRLEVVKIAQSGSRHPDCLKAIGFGLSDLLVSVAVAVMQTM
jgi:hypothetical protein